MERHGLWNLKYGDTKPMHGNGIGCMDSTLHWIGFESKKKVIFILTGRISNKFQFCRRKLIFTLTKDEKVSSSKIQFLMIFLVDVYQSILIFKNYPKLKLCVLQKTILKEWLSFFNRIYHWKLPSLRKHWRRECPRLVQNSYLWILLELLVTSSPSARDST